MRHHFPTVIALLSMLTAGCLTPRPYPAPNLPASARLIDISTPADDSQIRQVAGTEDSATGRQARNILVLSGGGMFGAYSAGVLKGWSATRRRPCFDVVTGVSTGALIAPFAFLGSEYDEMIERAYTSDDAANWYRLRAPPALFWSESVADSGPLRTRIEENITPTLVTKLGQAHRDGRRLYIGTTNLDTKSLVIWDVGAIAAGSDPHKVQLIREVLLASCAVPGLLPPVPITIEINGQRRSELHVDGGVSASLFLPRSVLPSRHRDGNDSTVSVIVAGKLKPDPRPVERRFWRVSGESLAAILQARFEGDLLRVFMAAHRAGAACRVTAIPEEMPLNTNWLKFDTTILRRMFETGYRFGAGGGEWLTNPPGLRPDDQEPPRTGVRFTVAP
jgi:predicted acylesterase/phospholipase RssA